MPRQMLANAHRPKYLCSQSRGDQQSRQWTSCQPRTLEARLAHRHGWHHVQGMLVTDTLLLRMCIAAAADSIDHADHIIKMSDLFFIFVILIMVAALAMIVAVAFVAGFLVAWDLLQGSRPTPATTTAS